MQKVRIISDIYSRNSLKHVSKENQGFIYLTISLLFTTKTGLFISLCNAIYYTIY